MLQTTTNLVPHQKFTNFIYYNTFFYSRIYNSSGLNRWNTEHKNSTKRFTVGVKSNLQVQDEKINIKLYVVANCKLCLNNTDN